LKACGIELT